MYPLVREKSDPQRCTSQRKKGTQGAPSHMADMAPQSRALINKNICVFSPVHWDAGGESWPLLQILPLEDLIALPVRSFKQVSHTAIWSWSQRKLKAHVVTSLSPAMHRSTIFAPLFASAMTEAIASTRRGRNC